MDKKFELTGESRMGRLGVMVHQIRATEDIPERRIRKGYVGGWVESADLPNGDAELEETWHYLVVGPIGSEGVTATLVRTKGGKHRLKVGCWEGTLGKLMAEVKRRRVGWSAGVATQEIWVLQYRALRDLGRATVKRWKEEVNEEL